MNRHASRSPFPWLLALTVLMPLMGLLLVAQAMSGSNVLWALFVVVAFAVFAVGVAAAAAARRSEVASAADAARLDELEPLPPAADGDVERG
ncbi:hypothetical protein ACQP1W_23175 [Spirillospora sp. CA-255316]